MYYTFVCLFLSEEESQESGNSQDESESSPTKKSPSKSFGEPSPTKTPAKPSFPESNNKDKVTYGDPPPLCDYDIDEISNAKKKEVDLCEAIFLIDQDEWVKCFLLLE